MQSMAVKTVPNVIGNLEDIDNLDQHSQQQPFMSHQPLLETSLNPMKTMTPNKHSMQARVKQRHANKAQASYILSGIKKLQALEKENGADTMQWTER